MSINMLNMLNMFNTSCSCFNKINICFVSTRLFPIRSNAVNTIFYNKLLSMCKKNPYIKK